MIEMAPGDDVATVLARVRAAREEAVVVVIPPEVTPVERALLCAAIAPLASELAPSQRVLGIDLSEPISTEDVHALADFFRGATAITGQVVQFARAERTHGPSESSTSA